MALGGMAIILVIDDYAESLDALASILKRGSSSPCVWHRLRMLVRIEEQNVRYES